ncbi:hypothetical protein NHJ13051_005373 [Beauveria bassiana]
MPSILAWILAWFFGNLEEEEEEEEEEKDLPIEFEPLLSLFEGLLLFVLVLVARARARACA